MPNFLCFARRALLPLILCSVASAADNPGQIIALKAARLFDGKSKALLTNGVVIVQGTTITEAEGSHVIMVSQPDIVAEVILTAAAAVAPQAAAAGG